MLNLNLNELKNIINLPSLVQNKGKNQSKTIFIKHVSLYNIILCLYL